MTNSTITNRNDDLVPMIVNAIAHNKAGNSEQRDICLCNINHKLMERGDEPSEFWASWVELMRALG